MKLTRAVLFDIKRESLRKRIWFRELTSVERSLVDLTVKVVEEVKSSRLATLLGAIVKKLEAACESGFLSRAWERGSELAERFARIAHSWGNLDAQEWAKDMTYIRYLGTSWI